VIEYGPFDQHEPSVLVPGLLDLDNTPYAFNITSTPQPGLNNRTYPIAAAAVVGGGTVINGLFFDRGSSPDYDAWEELGNPGWGWDGLLPYFQKVCFHVRWRCGIDSDIFRARISPQRPKTWQRNMVYRGMRLFMDLVDLSKRVTQYSSINLLVWCSTALLYSS
jgi:choline dehydrogenase-like flavoprotein